MTNSAPILPLFTPKNGESSLLFALPEKFFFFMNHMPRQADMSAHHHDCLEMAIVLGGKAVHRTTSGDSPCTPGQILLIPPGVWHGYADCRNLELYNCLLSDALLEGPLAWAANDLVLGPLLKPAPWQGGTQVLTWELPKSSLHETRKLLSGLMRTYSQTGVKRQGKLISELLLLLDFLALDGVPTHAPEPVFVHSAVRRAAKMLRGDLARAWTLTVLAEELRIHPSYLVRLFRQATGCAPMKFLAQERAQKAAQWLMISDLPLSEVGARGGWDEPKQFARSFRQHFGESASGFRRRLRNC